MKKFPLLITVIHGGEKIPSELRQYNNLTYSDILKDIDTFSRDIYDVSKGVQQYLDTEVARPYIDLNRAVYDRPPENKDGVIKTETVFQVPVYKRGFFPDENLTEKILQKYYYPFYSVLSEREAFPNLLAGFDCHTMLPLSPPVSSAPGIKRPLICLSNGGDREGKPLSKNKKTSCSADFIQQLAESFIHVLQCGKEQIGINNPFRGGNVIQSRGKGIIPWVQIELNRKLYLNQHQPLKKDKNKIKEVNKLILSVFKDFVSKLQ